MDFSAIRSLTAREIIAALESDGFLLATSSGSHRQYKHADGRRVTVSYHKGSDTFGIRILKSMIERQARWTEEDLRRLNIIK